VPIEKLMERTMEHPPVLRDAPAPNLRWLTPAPEVAGQSALWGDTARDPDDSPTSLRAAPPGEEARGRRCPYWAG
jgi:hypothetical protein